MESIFNGKTTRIYRFMGDLKTWHNSQDLCVSSFGVNLMMTFDIFLVKMDFIVVP